MLGLVLVLGACGDDEGPLVKNTGEGCAINSDCNQPLVCAFQRCHAQCEETRDCAPGLRCVIAEQPYRVCQLEDEQSCSYNSECPGAQVCAVDGQCRDQCQGDRDCVPGQVCATGTCASPEELVDGKLPETNQDPQSTGQPCSYTSECPDGLVCRDGICNYECLGDADCAPFTCDSAARRCVVPDAGVYYCVPGEQRSCGCAGGLVGEQVCQPDGLAFGPCEGCS